MARKLIVEIIGDSRSYERALGRSEKATRGFGSSLGQSVKNVAKAGAALAAVGVGVGTVAVKQFSSFEEVLERVVGLAGGTEKGVHDMGEEILKLGPQVAKSPQELAEALYFTASAGIALADQMDVVTVAAKGSTAGLGETQVVADAVTSAMNAYGAANLNAAQAADVLAATVREGKGEADAFAPVLGTVASIAAQLGVRFEEVGAALAAQTQLGVTAETSAIQLQAVFSSLLKGTEKAKKALAGVGLTLGGLRTQLKQKGLLSVLTTLKERFGDNTAAMAEAFPNIRALRGLLALVGKNAAQVRGVFGRMADSTGAIEHAFGAVSKGTTFAFEQMVASAKSAAIQLGAISAPLAKLIARGTTAALGVVNDFISELRHAKTIRAKLDVIWEGVKTAGERATDLLTRAVGAIDWKAVFAGATAISDEFQDMLEKVDWGFIGKEIGNAIKDAVGVIVPAAKEMADRIGQAFRTVDWEGLGREIGPGLASAVVTGFLTLLDPAFWVRNWDLALSVALVAFGGPIGRFAGRAAGLLVRVISAGLSRIAPALGAAFRGLAIQAVRLFGAALELGARAATSRLGDALLKPVRALFGKLGSAATFAVKVTGVFAAIQTLTNFAKRVGDIFQALPGVIRDLWNKVFNWLKRRAYKAALEVIEPFTHLPRFLGGGPFQDLKAEWQTTLSVMEAQADTSVQNIHDEFNTIDGRVLTVSVKTIVAPGEGRPPPPGKRKPGKDGKVVPDVTPDADDIDDVADDAENAETAADRASKAAARARTAFENLIDALTLKLDIAKSKAGFKGDINVLKAIRQAILDRIKIVGRTTELARMLFENTQELAETMRQMKQADIFKQLGLTETGDKPAPSSGALLKRAKSMLASLKGTVLDTAANRRQLKRIIAVLKENFKSAGREVRMAILQMLNDIAGAGDSTQAQGPLTKGKALNTRKIIEGLGLSDEEARNIRSRLSKFNSGGRSTAGAGTRSTSGMFVDDRPVIIHNHIHIDGQKVATSTTKHQQRGKRRNPRQKRGPNRGGMRGAL